MRVDPGPELVAYRDILFRELRGQQDQRVRQAQTILIAPAPSGATELQVDTNMFVKAGDEVNIDSGTGYSERATVATSENYMSLVLEKGLLKSYPAGTAVTTLPQDDDDDDF